MLEEYMSPLSQFSTLFKKNGDGKDFLSTQHAKHKRGQGWRGIQLEL